MKIGITEQGDAGLDFTWADKLPYVDGAVLITKNITDRFLHQVITAHEQGHKLIVHCGCTGWGGSPVEPHVPAYPQQLKKLNTLIKLGFPIEQCVLRIDPIFPTEKGLKRVCEVLNLAFDMGLLPKMRVRISVLDEYKHVKERFRKLGYDPIYKNKFYAPKKMMESVRATLSRYDIQFHTCAEPYLNDDTGLFVHSGCISEIDLRIMGLNTNGETGIYVNPQNRNGCQCLSVKTELLEHKQQCPHKCAYCYWQNDCKK